MSPPSQVFICFAWPDHLVAKCKLCVYWLLLPVSVSAFDWSVICSQTLQIPRRLLDMQLVHATSSDILTTAGWWNDFWSRLDTETLRQKSSTTPHCDGDYSIVHGLKNRQSGRRRRKRRRRDLEERLAMLSRPGMLIASEMRWEEKEEEEEEEMAIKRGRWFAIGAGGWRTCGLPGNSSTERIARQSVKKLRLETPNRWFIHSWNYRKRRTAAERERGGEQKLHKSINSSLCNGDVKHQIILRFCNFPSFQPFLSTTLQALKYLLTLRTINMITVRSINAVIECN